MRQFIEWTIIITGFTFLLYAVGCTKQQVKPSHSWTCTYEHPSPYKTKEICKENK